MLKAITENLGIIGVSASISGVLFGLAGLFIGNWQAIGRDKRKEFNAIAERIREKLIRERSGSVGRVTDVDYDLILQRLTPSDQSRFTDAWRKYRAAKNNISQDSYGAPINNNPAAVIAAIDALLIFAIPK